VSRYRLEPSAAQETVLSRHYGDARYVWNLAVEQHAWWRPGRKQAPGYLEQCRQQAPVPRDTRLLARKLSRAKRGSSRRQRARLALARVKAANADALTDWAHKVSTGISARYDVIRVEDLCIANMTRSAKGTVDAPGLNVRAKSGLNRSVLALGWGKFARLLEYKAPGRVQKINPAYPSQICSQCNTRDREARESQAVFPCRACGYCGNADVNAAAINIAAGHAVNAPAGDRIAGPANREPQLTLLAS
jgi:putative transposase